MKKDLKKKRTENTRSKMQSETRCRKKIEIQKNQKGNFTDDDLGNEGDIKKKKEYLIYGQNAVLSILINKSRVVKKILITQERFDEIDEKIKKDWGEKMKIVDAKRINILARTNKNQGILAYTSAIIEKTPLDVLLRKGKENMTIFMLDQLQDPRNIGSIIRSCYCFGVDAVVMPTLNSPDINCAVVRGSAGYSEIMHLYFVPNFTNLIKKLKSLDFLVFGLDMNGNQNVFDAMDYAKGKNLCVILGSEGFGMRDIVKKQCDSIVSVEMVEAADSLNVANVASIIAHARFSL